MLRTVLIFAIALQAAVSAGARANEIDPKSSEPPIRGILKSKHQATLSAEIQARILRLPVREGQHFKKGDLLVEFECDKLKAELAAANAELRNATASRDSNRSLMKLNAVGRLDVAMSEAQAEKAEAAADAARIRVEQCRILAPYSGRVADLLVNEFDMPQSNGTLMRIVDDESLEIDLIAPSSWLRWLKPGSEFDLLIDETGSSLPARIERVGAAVDAVSQTVKLTAVLSGARPPEVLPGMSGTAIFPATEH